MAVRKFQIVSFPVLCVIMALGVALMALACSASRMQVNGSQPLFWLGFLVLLVPASARLLMDETSHNERLGILMMLAFGYYLIKVLYNPNAFGFNDELQHFRSAKDLLQNNLLFQKNPSLQVSTYYPGLEIVTDALIKMTGLSIFQAATVLMGVVHSLLVVVLFLFYERLSRSTYLASIAALVFFASPSFMLGYSQFAYEPLALVLFYFALYLLADQIRALAPGNVHALALTVPLFLFAVIITHHVTSFFFAGLLSLWMVLAYVQKSPFENRRIVAAAAFVAIAGCVAWSVATGSTRLAAAYIGAPVQRAVDGVVGLALGTGAPRTLFRQGGQETPIWLQIPSFLSVGLILLTLPLGLLALWRKMARNSLILALGVMSLGFVVAQVMRFSPTGLAMTNRLAAPIFLPLSFVLAAGAARYIHPVGFGRFWRVGLVTWACLINLGSATAVVAAWQLPGPYDPHIFTRTIGKEGIASAEWAKQALGPHHPFGADFINMMLMASYGEQDVITEENNFFAESSVFGATQFTEVEKNYLREHGVAYLVIDNRLPNHLVTAPRSQNTRYFPTQLDGQAVVSRIYDAGAITIYHLGFVAPFDLASGPRLRTP